MSLFLALAGVQADNLGYLIAYGIDGVEARHGILKDYRNLVAPDFAHFFFAHLVNLMTVEIYRTADELAGISGKPHDGISGDGLARAGLADYAEHLALLHGEGHAVQRLDFARGGKERESFVFYFQKFFAQSSRPPCQFFSFGSNASRSPSPKRLNARMMMLISIAGKNSRCG